MLFVTFQCAIDAFGDEVLHLPRCILAVSQHFTTLLERRNVLMMLMKLFVLTAS